jgi:hypothetical protein
MEIRMATDYISFSSTIDDLTVDEVKFWEDFLESDEAEHYETHFISLQKSGDGAPYVWFHGDEGYTDLFLDKVQDFIRTFRPDFTFVMMAAETCSRPRVDAFGGHAVYITKDEIDTHSLIDWVVFKKEETKRWKELVAAEGSHE